MQTTSRWPFVAVAVVIGIVSGFAGLIGSAVGSAQANITTAIVLRTVLAVLPMAAFTAFAAGRWAGSSGTYAVVAVCSYLLMPLSWLGQSLLSQLLVDNNAVTLIVDGIFWVAVMLGVVALERRRNPRARPQAPQQMEVTW